jgi:uncharacterized membrane protein
MGRVSAAMTFPGTVHVAERAWYDVERWPTWVEGLAAVEAVSADWPSTGADVRWRSGPAGRGRVSEHVVEHEPLVGQTVAVEDQSISGRQTVTFTPVGDEVEVRLELEYEVRNQSALTGVVDRLFIRGAMERSLRATLARFGAELAATSEPGLG